MTAKQVEVSMPSRAAAQTPLHKMYTFVYRTFIKFILFCRGQAPDVALPIFCRGQALDATELLLHCEIPWFMKMIVSMPSRAWVVTFFPFSVIEYLVSFNALTGLSCYFLTAQCASWQRRFQCPHGLELLQHETLKQKVATLFQCPHGLELLHQCVLQFSQWCGFNALTGLSCYLLVLRYPVGCYRFNALTGLSCYVKYGKRTRLRGMFQCPHGLELLRLTYEVRGINPRCFNALTGLSCYHKEALNEFEKQCFNALTGLSCYSKNVQYFKFFMILFMHTCYL